jgi:hypothetical protein
MYRNKLIQWGLLVVFSAIAVGLIYLSQDRQFIPTTKAASQAMPGGDLSVVGKPTLPAATVDAIFKDLGSPMSGTGQVVEQVSRQTNIDDAFALAVWWTETNDGAAGVGLADKNPGSVRGSIGYPSAFDGYTIYPSYSAAIVYWFNMLKNMYVNRGLNTVYRISYPYVGTASSPLWAGKVVALMFKYRGEAPPVPIVVPHGKRVTEPSIYRSITPTPALQKHQAQSQPVKTTKNSASTMVPRANSSSMSFVAAYTVVFLALLLALAIVAYVLWFEKWSDHNRKGVRASDETRQVEDKRVELHLYQIQKVRPFRSITLYPLQDESAPNTDALTSTAPEIEVDIVQTDALVMLAEMNTGEHFRIRGKIFLPSAPLTDPAASEQSTSTTSLRVRSTGLLSRYGEIHQE